MPQSPNSTLTPQLPIPECPRCHSPWIKAKSLTGSESEFWYQCSNPKCNTYYNSYVPQYHQAQFHKDSHRFTANFGGYGSGKTTTTREEIMKHFFITPGGNTIIGANVMSQYEQTLKRELYADIPRAFVARTSTQKDYIDLINGHRVMWRPFDDPDKLRSYNVTQFVILEASEVKPATYVQLKTRLRNRAASTQTPTPADWRRGIIESNPDSGWIRDDILFTAESIETHGTVLDHFTDLQVASELDPFTSAHITSTDANKYLPDDFIEMNSKNKPPWWVAKYIYGSFIYSQGTIYPNTPKTIIVSFEIPREWKRIIAFDYGLQDPSVFLFGAIDEKEGNLIIYKEVYTTENNIEQLAALYFSNTEDIPSGNLLSSMIIDPKSGPRRDYEKKSLSDHFMDFGIATRPGYISKDARILRTNTYIESGKLKIFETCTTLLREMREYKFKADDKAVSGFTSKPVDGNDHGISCLEWICMDLPADPSKIVYGAYNKLGVDLTAIKRQEDPGYWALADSDPYTKSDHENPFDYVDYEYNFF